MKGQCMEVYAKCERHSGLFATCAVSLAMVSPLVKLTWFITFSHAKFLWVELIPAVELGNGIHFTDDEVMNMKWSKKANYQCKYMSNFVEIFQCHQELFFSEYILTPTLLLGNVKDFALKVEFCHLWTGDFWWVDGALNIYVQMDV